MIKDKEKFRVRYVTLRKKLLRDMQTLTYQRVQLNKKIRKVQEDLQNWDKVLLTEYEED